MERCRPRLVACSRSRNARKSSGPGGRRLGERRPSRRVGRCRMPSCRAVGPGPTPEPRRPPAVATEEPIHKEEPMSRRLLTDLRRPAAALVSRGLPALAVAVALIACDQSKPELEKTLAQVQQISAQKDTLMQEVSTTSQFIVDLNSEIDKARRPGGRQATKAANGEMGDNMTAAERRADVLQKVKELSARLNDSEDRLVASRKRIADISGKNAADDPTARGLRLDDRVVQEHHRQPEGRDREPERAGRLAVRRELAAQGQQRPAGRGQVAAHERAEHGLLHHRHEGRVCSGNTSSNRPAD